MVEKEDCQKEPWERKKPDKNPFPALSLTLENRHQTGGASGGGYMQ